MPKPRRKNIPAYRLHKPTGQGVVTLTDATTGRRVDRYLGEHDTPESRRRYAEVLAEWEAAGRIIEGCRPLPPRGDAEATVTALSVAYLDHVLARYGGKPEGRACDVKQALKVLRSLYGRTPAAEFGPLKLRAVQEAMVGKGWNRDTVNDRARAVRNAFRHGVALELIPAGVYAALECVPAIRRGEQGVREGRSIPPVHAVTVQAVLPHLSRPVAGIVLLMQLTGARCDEVCRLTPAMIDTTGKVWRADLADHKTAHHGKRRTLWIGPKAQDVLRDFLHGELDKAIFRPTAADADLRQRRREARKTPESCGNKPGSNRRATPTRKPGERYTTGVVRRAIERACERAGVEVFTPHALRKLAGTTIRKEAGLEAAAVILGHSSPTITDALYAARDESVALDVIRKIG